MNDLAEKTVKFSEKGPGSRFSKTDGWLKLAIITVHYLPSGKDIDQAYQQQTSK